MPLIIQKVSDHGTGEPGVARLTLQMHELIEWVALDKEKRDEVLEICYDLKDRLMNCQDIFDNLKQSLSKSEEDCKKEPQGKAVRVPYVIDLETNAENFLYQAKNFLRDLTLILNIFYGTDFKEASEFFDASGKADGKIVKWALEKFGKQDFVAQNLQQDQTWIGKMIKKRNAVEHPGGYNGTLHIENCKFENGKLILPAWFRDQSDASFVLEDMEVVLHNLLTMGEELIIFGCFEKKLRTSMVGFQEIPEEKRRPECPIRFKAALINQSPRLD